MPFGLNSVVKELANGAYSDSSTVFEDGRTFFPLDPRNIVALMGMYVCDGCTACL